MASNTIFRSMALRLKALSGVNVSTNATPALTRSFATGDDNVPITEKIKQAASKVTEKVSDMMGGAKETVKDAMGEAKEFVKDTKDRINYDTETFPGRMESKAEDAGRKTREMAERVVGGTANMASDISEKASEAASEGRGAHAVDTASRATSELHDAVTGERGVPHTGGGGGAKVDVADVTGEAQGVMPAGTRPLERTGTRLAKDREGKEASMT